MAEMIDITLIDTHTNESFLLSENSFVYVLQKVQWDPVKSSQNLVQFTNLIGSRMTSVSLEPRDLYIVGWVVAEDEETMKERKTPLNKFINPLHKYIMVYKGYAIDFYPNTSVQYASDYVENNDILCKFMIEGTCENPLFSLVDKKIKNISDTNKTPVKLFPMVIPKTVGMIFGITVDLGSTVIHNDGDVDVGLKVTVKATDGSVTNPMIVNDSTKEKMKVNYVMSKGDSIRFSTIYGEEEITLIKANGEQSDIFNRLTKDSVMFSLGQGDTTILFEADEDKSNMSFDIEFSPLFLEVQ